MLKICRKIIFLITLLCSCNLAATQSPQFQDLTILVSSCDKYSEFWTPFFMSLFKQWPSLLTDNKTMPIILITNSKQYTDARVITLNVGKDTSWSDNMIAALQQVKTKYVLLALDDYWIDKPVNETRLYQVFNLMRREQAAMLQVTNNVAIYQYGTPVPGAADVLYTEKFTHYKASLQPAIWEVKALQALLKPGEDPWTFEIAGTARSHGYPQPFMCLAGNEPIAYINAAHQGHVNPQALAYAQQFNMPFDPKNFPVLGKYNLKIKLSVWKKRLAKLLLFVRNPSSFYHV